MSAKYPEYARIIWLQGAITTIGAVFTYWIATPPATKSLVYGGSVALASTLLLAWRSRQAERKREQDAGKILRQAYRAAIERFAWIIVLLGTGFGPLKLASPWVLAGFVVGQAAWLLLPLWVNLRTKNDC